VIAGKLRLELKPVSLQSAIRAAMDAVRPAADARRILVDTVLPSGTVSVSGDTHRLQQVVWNLLANAVAFTPEGGRITITLERSNTDAIMSVTDTGQGIQPEFLPYIFERFRQADSTSTRRHGGLGLGLAIVQHVVELHGGTVSAESAGTGRGATFTVRLPLLAEGTPVAGAVSGALRPVDTGGAAVLDGFHVLVVDDDADTCDLLAVVLGYYGAAVTPVRSADEALHTLDRMRPDVVVSDIAMPGVDGYELARRLKRIERERGWRLPALALTAHARAADTEQAFLAGFEACVAKPVEPAELAQVIARLAGRAETQGVR
jgi:CheY-like chemotaxis protein